MAGPKSPQPLHGKLIYLDLFGFRRIKALERQLLLLGAVLEKCFSREVTHIITNREEKKLPTQNGKKNEAKDKVLFSKTARSPSDGLIESLSPFADSPCNIDIVSRPMTRGQAIVQRATVMKNLGSTNVVECARLWGIKVIHVDAAEKWLQKEVEKLGVRKGKSKAKVFKLRQPSVKVEDSSLRFSPEYKLLRFFPAVTFDAPKGCHPFGRQFGAGNVSRSSGGPLVILERIDFDEKKLDKFRKRLRSGTDSLPSKEDRLLTAGELQRLNRDRKAAFRSRGVCEVCNVKYNNISQHLRTERHKLYAEDDQNYKTLDRLIDQFKTVSGNSQSADDGIATGQSEPHGEDFNRPLGFLSLPGSRVLAAAGEEDRSSSSTEYVVRNIPEKKQCKDMFVENTNEISAKCLHTKKSASLLTTGQQRASAIGNPDGQKNRSQRRKFELDDGWNPRDVACLSGCDEISDAVVELSDITAMSDLSSELPVIRPIQLERPDFQLRAHNVVRNSYSGDCCKQQHISAKSEAQPVMEVGHVLPCVELQKVKRLQLPRPVSVATENSMLKLFESQRSLSDFQGFSEASDSIIGEMSYCEVSQATFDTDLDFDCLEKSASSCISGIQPFGKFSPSSDDDFVLEDAHLRDADVTTTHVAGGNGLVSKEMTLSPKSYSSIKSSFGAVEPLSAAKRVRCAHTLSVEASQNLSSERLIMLTENLRYSTRLSWQPKVHLVPYDSTRRYVDDRSSRICRNSQPCVRVVRCDNVLCGNLEDGFNRIHENTTKQSCIPLEIGRSRSKSKQILPEDDHPKRLDGCNLQVNQCRPRNKKKGRSKYQQLCSLGVASEGLLNSSSVGTIINIDSETSSTSLYKFDRNDETFSSKTSTKGHYFPVASTSFIEIKPKELVSAKKRVFDEDDILGITENSDQGDSCLRFEVCTDEKESGRLSLTSAKRKSPSPAYRVTHKRKWQPCVVLEDFMLTQTKRL